MAFTEFYVQTTGSNLNGGSTTSDNATYTGVGDSDGTSVFTPSDGSTPASSVNVGDFASVYVTSGATVAVFVGRVTTVAAGVNGAITVSTTAKSGTFPSASAGAHTITCKVGGAWQGPNGAVAFPFGFITNALTDSGGDYPRVNFKSGTNYAITAAMTHNKAGPIYFQGYTSSAGDGGKATVDGGTSGTSYTLLAVSVVQTVLRDLIFQNNGSTGTSAGLSLSGAACRCERIVVNSVCGNGFSLTNNVALLECEAYSCNQNNGLSGGFRVGTDGASLVRCIAHDNAGNQSAGFRIVAACTLVACVADTNGNGGFTVTNSPSVSLENCDAYNNTGPGLNITGSNSTVTAENCVLSQNSTYGVGNSGTGNVVRLSNCAFYLNTSGQTNGTVDATGSITLSGDPFNDAANGDFSLNNTTGAGASCRGAGRGVYVGTASYSKTTTGYPDVGAAQHQDTGGGGGVMGARIFTGF